MRTPSALQFDSIRRPPAVRQTWPGVWIGRRWWLLGALTFYAFALQGARGLWEPDEGRYTAVALEMERLGDYVVPHLHHEVKHVTKPPLTYWLIAGSLAAFGHSEWAARLPNSLAFLTTILLIARAGRRLAPDAALLAPLIYATSLLPFTAANIVTTDTLLTLWETLAVLGFVELWWGPEERRGFYRIVTWLGFGLAFLTKGPPGLLPLAVIVVLSATCRYCQACGAASGGAPRRGRGPCFRCAAKTDRRFSQSESHARIHRRAARRARRARLLPSAVFTFTTARPKDFLLSGL
jgi:hypothetical protein